MIYKVIVSCQKISYKWFNIGQKNQNTGIYVALIMAHKYVPVVSCLNSP